MKLTSLYNLYISGISTRDQSVTQDDKCTYLSITRLTGS